VRSVPTCDKQDKLGIRKQPEFSCGELVAEAGEKLRWSRNTENTVKMVSNNIVITT
jgi:hypothetical protein